MPSPFPGMDPWLESPLVFPDFHDSFLAKLKEFLNRDLPEGTYAKLNRIVLTEDRQRRVPDVSLFNTLGAPGQPSSVAMLPGLTTWVDVELDLEVDEEQYLEIRSVADEQLITAIELLSPSNKQQGHSSREHYLAKQLEFLGGGVNLVEIDLLRAGMCTSMMHRTLTEGEDIVCDYHIAVTVPALKSRIHANFLSMTQSLPTIGIPLTSQHAPVLINMQSVFDETYDYGRYPSHVKYDRPPTPPLNAEQQLWADELIKQHRAG